MKQCFYFLVALMTISTTGILAQIPKEIDYQGMLLDMNEQPIPDGNYKITFKLYDESSILLWTEVHNQVPIGGGLLHAHLGTETLLNLAFDKPYFLGIQIGNDPELEPRLMLTSSAYSFKAEDANQVGGFHVSSTPQPNALLPLDGNSKFPASVLTGGISGEFIKKDEPDTSQATSTVPVLLVSNLGSGDGINGRAVSGIGMAGRSTGNDGVTGWTEDSSKSGVLGFSTLGKGVAGRSDNNDGVVGWTGAGRHSGVFGHSTDGYGVSGLSSGNHAVYGYTTSENIDHAGVYGLAESGNGVRGKSTNGIGVNGGSVNGNGVVGWTGTSTSGAYCGVLGWSVNGTGVRGTSDNYIGVQATTKSNIHAAIAAGNEGAGPAIYAQAGTNKIAAVFRGNVQVQSMTTLATILELGEGLDYAEGFDVSHGKEIAPGTVLVIDPGHPGELTVSSRAYDRTVAGIVAGAKGLGSGVRLGSEQFDCDVALAGRVYCNVDATEQEINPGDLLTTSTTRGYAMTVKNHSKAQGAILGKAMESLPKGKKGQILVLVSLQ